MAVLRTCRKSLLLLLMIGMAAINTFSAFRTSFSALFSNEDVVRLTPTLQCPGYEEEPAIANDNDLSSQTEAPTYNLRPAEEKKKKRNNKKAANRQPTKPITDKLTEPTAKSTPTDSSFEPTMTLLTSFWAQPENEEIKPHRAEIEAAMVVNLDNPYITQMVLVLDGITPQANCTHFQKRMALLFQKQTQQVYGVEGSKKRKMSELTCIDRPEGQPTYLDMFQYSQHKAIKGRVVVLSNADHAFDDTIWRAAYVKPNTIVTLSSRGYAVDKKKTRGFDRLTVPEVIRQHYKTSGVQEGPLKIASDWCHPHWFTRSWDTYIFVPTTIENKIRPTDFQRTLHNNETEHFYMNEMGAERAAMNDLVEILARKPDENMRLRPHRNRKRKLKVTTYNGCRLIHSFHFHFAPKMHTSDHKLRWGGKSNHVPRPKWDEAKLLEDPVSPDLFYPRINQTTAN